MLYILYTIIVQFPVPEYNWNSSDSVLVGDMDLIPFSEVGKGVRPKRLRFCIIPDNSIQIITAEQEQAYFTKLEKLINFLKSKMNKTVIINLIKDAFKTAREISSTKANILKKLEKDSLTLPCQFCHREVTINEIHFFHGTIEG